MEEFKNKLGAFFLVLILLIFIIGGYFAMKYFTKDPTEEEKTTEVSVDLRIDNTKDYIYYDNKTDVLESEEIHKMDIIINLKGQESLNETLKSENEELYKSIKYIKDINVEVSDEDNNDEGIYSLNFRNYEDYEFGKYLSVVIRDLSFDVINKIVPISNKSYVFDKNTGKLITEEELLSSFNITNDTISSKIKERLNDTQIVSEDKNVIDIDKTMEGISNHSLYINKRGKLEVTFIVKSNNTDYNDSVELN